VGLPAGGVVLVCASAGDSIRALTAEAVRSFVSIG
jgi:hypothetical protein